MTRRRLLLGILVAGVLAAVQLRLDPRDLWTGGSPELAWRFLAAAFRPALVAESGSGRWLLGDVLAGLRDTVLFAAGGLSLAMLAAVPLGFLASCAWRDGGPSPGTHAVRLVLAAMRSVHELLWAVLLLAALGASPTAGVVAIAIPYAGTLAKVFSEMLDEAPRGAALALRGAGATAGQQFVAGLLPRALPDMASYTFYRFECALRSSAVLGFFGFPTLGYHLSLSFENLHYREVWTWLYGMFALVVLVELWSGRLRRRGDFA